MHNKFTEKGSIGIIKENWLEKGFEKVLLAYGNNQINFMVQ